MAGSVELELEQAGPVEFRFRWNAAEHRRFYRALQVEARRGSRTQLLLRVWLYSCAALFILILARTRTWGEALWPAEILASIVAWIAFDRWGMAYLAARSYRRDHAACIAADQVRLFTADGIEARCTTSTSAVRWSGILRVSETPEFFLFMTTRACAIQLPKRAVRDIVQFREWLRGRAASGEVANTAAHPQPIS
jgi:hypothetical protein